MSDTSGDLKWYLTPLFKWLNHVLKSPFILTGVSALRHRQTLQNPHPSWGVFIWELDPVSSQHHKNYLSKRDLQVPYREKGMIWILEVKIYRGYTCWRHQKRLWCAFLLLFWMKFRLWWPVRALFHALPHPAVEQATSQRTKIWSSVQRLEWCREMTSTWLSNIGFPLCLLPAATENYSLTELAPAVRPLHVIISAHKPIEQHKNPIQAVKSHETRMNERGLCHPGLQWQLWHTRKP